MTLKLERLNPLTVEKIVDASLAMVGEEGLARLSMRRLGARLGVEAMTLYHHVPSKGALLDLLLERFVLKAAPGGDDRQTDWRDWLQQFALCYRLALLEHPALLPLVETRPIRAPGALSLFEDGVRTLREAGFSSDQSLQICNVVGMFVIGHALAEAGQPLQGIEEDEKPVPIDDASADAAAKILGVPNSLGRSHQAIFDFGVTALIDGFMMILSRAQPRSGKV